MPFNCLLNLVFKILLMLVVVFFEKHHFLSLRVILIKSI